MNGKHPIDDLFARNLRDAEAQPPSAVWESIVRKRDRGHTAIQRLRRHWGYAALLLLLLGGGAGYWAATTTGEPTSRVVAPGEVNSANDQAAGSKSGTASTPILGEASKDATGEPGSLKASDGAATMTGGSSDHHKEAAGGSTTEVASPHIKTTATDNTPVPSKTPPKNETAKPQIAGATGGGSVSTHGERNGSDQKASSVRSGGIPTPALAVVAGGAGSPGTAPPDQRTGSVQNPRVAPDFNLPKLTGTAIVLSASTAPPPGPILHGDPTAPYVMAKHNWWVAGQFEWAAIEGEWKGAGSEVQALNESETWQEGHGLGLAAGLQWQSGWSAGLGVGLSQQRSRFLRRVVGPGSNEVVVDTTWTGSPQGQQVTNYTWDIVETLISEPGTEQDYSATNTYTQLRIAPEVGYRIVEQKRWSLYARFSPVLISTLGRKGSTLVTTTASDPSDTFGPELGVVALDDAAVDERFPMTFALSGGVDLRYRVCDHWSIGVLPTFTHWLSRSGDTNPVLSMNELGGALRLRCDFRHHERRTK